MQNAAAPTTVRDAYPVARLGIIGGGQLARMTAAKALQLGCEVRILDPHPSAPAAVLATQHVVGRLDDPASIRELVDASDVTTYDIEHIDAATLDALHAAGHDIHPAPSLLALIQDKLAQKEALKKSGLPHPEYVRCDAPTPEAFAAFGYPLVQKLRHGGYDGKGVAVLESGGDFDRHLAGPSLLERVADIALELGVMVARGRDGSTAVYPVTEMAFNPDGNLLDMLLAPARIPDEVAEHARQLAVDAVNAVDGVGIFGIELFYTGNGDLLFNEMAPRPHNSGHYTMNACVTCQFEQHVRAVLGLPLGSTELLRPCALVNLLGAPGAAGPPRLAGLDAALAIPGVAVHIYGKDESRPLRKMGHVNVVDCTLDAAIEKARRVRGLLNISGGATHG